MMQLPKIVFTDIDGVWTDGGMYYDQTGNELKKFNTSDSAGVLFCKLLDIKVVILTGENTDIVKRRSEKLKIDYLFQGCKNKLKTVLELTSQLQINLSEAAYIGDDIIDIPLLEKVGFSCAPQNAPDYVKDKVNYVTQLKGGDGAFREFIEAILKQTNKLDTALTLAINHYEK